MKNTIFPYTHTQYFAIKDVVVTVGLLACSCCYCCCIRRHALHTYTHTHTFTPATIFWFYFLICIQNIHFFTAYIYIVLYHRQKKQFSYCRPFFYMLFTMILLRLVFCIVIFFQKKKQMKTKRKATQKNDSFKNTNNKHDETNANTNFRICLQWLFSSDICTLNTITHYAYILLYSKMFLCEHEWSKR